MLLLLLLLLMLLQKEKRCGCCAVNLQEQLPDLFDHFMDLGLAAHMYASQWFLTLFTAKFPLFVVYHILDLFLSEVVHFDFFLLCKSYVVNLIVSKG